MTTEWHRQYSVSTHSNSSPKTDDFASASEGPDPTSDLLSSFYSERDYPFWTKTKPFQSFLHSILQFNQNPCPSKEMATNPNEMNTGATSQIAKMALPWEFSGKREELN